MMGRRRFLTLAGLAAVFPMLRQRITVRKVFTVTDVSEPMEGVYRYVMVEAPNDQGHPTSKATIILDSEPVGHGWAVGQTVQASYE